MPVRKVKLADLLAQHPPMSVRERRARAYEREVGLDVCDKIAREYAGGLSVAAVARRHGVGTQACGGILRRRGLVIRKGPEYLRAFPVDEHCFDVIDSEAKAYWLGFLAADATIHRTTVEVEVKRSDWGHLLKLRRVLAPEAPIRWHRVNVKGRCLIQARLTVASRPLVDALARLGVTERKSRTLRPCATLPPALVRHYFRGLFDGDGSIWTNEARTEWHAELTSSWEMAEAFRSFLLTNGIATRARVLPAKGVARFGVGGLDLPRAVAGLLYRDAHVALSRKQALAKELLARAGRSDAIRAATPGRYRALRALGLDERACARAMGMGPTALWELRTEWGFVGRRS